MLRLVTITCMLAMVIGALAMVAGKLMMVPGIVVMVVGLIATVAVTPVAMVGVPAARVRPPTVCPEKLSCGLKNRKKRCAVDKKCVFLHPEQAFLYL